MVWVSVGNIKGPQGDSGGGTAMKLWVSGETYAVNDVVVSPISYHQYIRVVEGDGTTDPSSDKTNWRLIGAGGIKSIQKGVLFIAANSSSASVTISSVDPDACVANISAFGTTAAGAVNSARSNYSISETQLTISRQQATSAGCYIPWEIVEHWA